MEVAFLFRVKYLFFALYIHYSESAKVKMHAEAGIKHSTIMQLQIKGA
jgi:hypothetical protein